MGRERFEQAVEPHIDAAYNLARWMLGDATAADDAVQDSCVKALEGIGGLRRADGRQWLLAIVRNVCRDLLRGKKREGVAFEPELHDREALRSDQSPDPEALRMRLEDRATLARALEALPAEYREILILREMEELSYKELANVLDVPMGTVMSRLARARERMRVLLQGGER